MLGVFVSSAVELERITLDLALVLLRLNESIDGSEKEKIGDLLIFMDGTNACIFLSGYYPRSKETTDERMIMMQVHELLGDDYMADDFADLIENASRILMNTELGNKLRSRFDIWIQDEVSQARRLTVSLRKE